MRNHSNLYRKVRVGENKCKMVYKYCMFKEGWCTNIVCSKDLWQVTHIERTYEVNLAERKCGCFKWDLTCIPCKHAIAAIHKAKGFPEDYVSDFFKKPMYKKAYKNLIYPVPG
jgi:hypothetical protein